MDNSDLGHDMDMVKRMLEWYGLSAVLVILTAACASMTERAVETGNFVAAATWTRRSAALRDLRLDLDCERRDVFFEKQDE